MKIKECRACRSKQVVQFLDLGNQPFANALLEPGFEEEKKYPLSLSYCTDCSLVQLDYTAAPEELFSNYFWVTSTSSTAREYAKQFYEGVKAYIKEDRRYVLEIASNDGTFLKEFKEHGYEVLGVDPAKNIAKQANEQGIATRVDFFQKTVAEEIVKEKGYPSVIYARNVLPHVADLSGFVEGLACCCGDDNLLVIEVHYSGKILDELHYDSIYHEHLHYFTLTSVINLLKHYGLFVFDVSLSPISGGSVVLYVSRKEIESSGFLKNMLKEEEKLGYNTLERWDTFAKTAEKHRASFNDKNPTGRGEKDCSLWGVCQKFYHVKLLWDRKGNDSGSHRSEYFETGTSDTGKSYADWFSGENTGRKAGCDLIACLEF